MGEWFRTVGRGWLRARGMRTGLALALAVVAVTAVVGAAAGRRPYRIRLGGPASSEPAPAASSERLSRLPVEQWTAQIVALERAGQWARLDVELQQVERDLPEPFAQYALGYLLARARLEHGDLDGAEKGLEPFLAPAHPWRDLALWHRARIADARGDEADALRWREELVFGFAKATHRQDALEDALSSLDGQEPAAIQSFATRLGAGTDPDAQRELEARQVEALARTDADAALDRGLRLLRVRYTDDPAERVARSLDRPDLLQRMAPADRVMLAESAREHRHFERAIPLLREAVEALPKQREDLLFSLGRALFGDEKYDEAEKVYLRGESVARKPEQKALFLYHAGRCAQLVGDDTRAERDMARAIAVGRSYPKTAASITQRLRTRAKRGDLAGAAADLQLLRKRFPRVHALVEGSLAYATALTAAGKRAEARRVFDAVPDTLLDRWDPSEIAYWTGRGLEADDPAAALRAYLVVLRAPVSTHFAWFARERLKQPALAAAARAEVARLRALVAERIAAADPDGARPLQTDVVLLSPGDAAERDRLRDVYAHAPAYSAILALAPAAFPHLPLQPGPEGTIDRHDLLLALGLFDDAADLIPARFPLDSAASALTRAEALALAGSTRGSISAAETVLKSVPADFVFDLLPARLQQLLYPQYFYELVKPQSQKYGADPRLVLSIMREESRFNPRAKSPASARGLLQFILSTARQVGALVGLQDVNPEDLYDPGTIVTLGARYIADLSRAFEGDGYKVAGAYNAGPNQVKLWSRLAVEPGDDAFLSAVNFDETKDYVRKVQNTYRRYVEMYPDASAPAAAAAASR